jgi:hypothetical protein
MLFTERHWAKQHEFNGPTPDLRNKALAEFIFVPHCLSVSLSGPPPVAKVA